MKPLLLALCVLLLACTRRYEGIADGEFTADGLVVDTKGNPIAGARIKGRGRVVESTASGCFHLFEVTAEEKHESPFSVDAGGFPRISGKVPAPGHVRLRVTAETAASDFADAVTINPPAGSLGGCEPKSRR